jgi:hypothetical protein
MTDLLMFVYALIPDREDQKAVILTALLKKVCLCAHPDREDQKAAILAALFKKIFYFPVEFNSAARCTAARMR